MKRFAATIPVRRWAIRKRSATFALFLCSPNAGYLTGQSIVVDGGGNRPI
jgi:3-oxoacyl-[acyl-carrier protein] reductase